MKKLIFGFMAGFLLIGVNAFAGDGDLIVNGNVGIGTTEPANLLHVKRANTHVGLNIESSSAGHNSHVRLMSAGTYDAELGLSDIGQYAYLGRSGTATGFLNVDLTNGNVGIGTTGPGAKIHVEAPSAPYGQLRILSTGSGAGGTAAILIGRTEQTDEQRWLFGQGVSGSIGDSFGIYTGGSPKLVIQTGGNVGIGTTAPSQKLHIYKDSLGDSPQLYIQQEPSVAGSALIRLDSAGAGGNSSGILFGVDARIYRDNAYPSTISMGSDSNPLNATLNVKVDTGNVGIGTTAPNQTLHIKSSSGAPLRIESTLNNPGERGGIEFYSPQDSSVWSGRISLSDGGNDGGLVLVTSGDSDFDNMDDILFKTDNSEKMRITSGGNIGIGRTDPNAKLHVAGVVIIDDLLSLGWRNEPPTPPAGQLYIWHDSDGSNSSLKVKFSNGVVKTLAAP